MKTKSSRSPPQSANWRQPWEDEDGRLWEVWGNDTRGYWIGRHGVNDAGFSVLSDESEFSSSDEARAFVKTRKHEADKLKRLKAFK